MKSLPGILLCALLATIAYTLHSLPFWPFTIGAGVHPIEGIVIAIILGIIINNTVTLPAVFQEGINLTVKKFLPLAIIFLGSELNFFEVIHVSLEALYINVFCVAVALVLTIWLCKKAGVANKLGILIGIGTAICGGTAIVVTAPIIKASNNETVISIATITLFGLLAIFLYPVLGHLLGMGQTSFGIWAGTAIQAIPQVVAAGFAYGTQAGQVGTIVKLVRILLLAPVILLLNVWQTRQEHRETLEKTSVPWYTYFPPFILGFLLMVVANSLGLFHEFSVQGVKVNPVASFNLIASFLFVMVMAGLGLQTNFSGLIRSGWKPLCVGFASAIIMAGLSLLLIRIFLGF